MRTIFLMCLGIILGMNIYAEETNYHKIELTERCEYYKISTPLNPENVLKISDGFKDSSEYFFEYKYKNDTFSFQAADKGFKTKDRDFQNKITELYLSANVLGNFLDFGKKKISQSICFIQSPMDFTVNNNSKFLSQSKDEQSKLEEGKFLTNVDIYSEFGLFSISYIPKIDFTDDLNLKDKIQKYVSSTQNEQFLVRYAKDLYDIDISASVSKDDTLRAGLNFSGSLLDNSLMFYGEGVWTREINKNRINVKQIPTGQNIFTDIINIKSEKIENACDLIIGSEYAFGDFTMRGEYLYNNHGYDIDEWKSNIELIKKVRSDYDMDKLELQKGNLGNLITLISNEDVGNLCRHYLLGRIAYNGLQNDKWDFNLTSLMNAQDMSGMVLGNATYSGWNNAAITITPSASFGNEYSEYKLSGFDSGIKIELVYGL